MGFHPENGIGSRYAFSVSAVGKSGGIFFIGIFQGIVTADTVGDCHIGMIAGNDICSRIAEYFRIDIGFRLIPTVGIVFHAIDNIRPEITFAVVGIGRQFNMLCRIKAEAVNTAVNALFQETEHFTLHFCIACIQIGHTDMTVC